VSGWFRADETWPEHDKPHWRKPMKQAQAAGWSLEYIDAPHLFGYAWCPGKQHKFKVDKTATGAAFWASEASKIITRNCRHGTATGAGKVRERQDTALRTLEALDSVLDAVGRDIEILEAIGEGWERAVQLEHARDALLLRLETAQFTLAGLSEDADGMDDSPSLAPGATGQDAGDDQDVAALDQELEAQLEAVTKLEPGPQPAQLRTTLVEADATADEVEQLASDLSRRPGLAGGLRASAVAARARIEGLFARLGGLERRSPLDG